MRILYGITANGNGHLSRSRRIVAALRARGHDIELVISGEPGKAIMNADELAPYLRFDGFSFAQVDGVMDPLATFLKARPFRFIKDAASGLPSGAFDLAVTDYEPLVAWRAKVLGIPSVGICHMYSYLYEGVPMPDAAWYERLAFRWLAPASLMLGIHWHPYHRNVIPPFVEAIDLSREDEGQALVYLPWEDPDSYLPALQAVPDRRFIVYGKASGEAGNVVFKTSDRCGFLDDLGRCASVIANAGFSLASEAASYGKRLMLKPYPGQVEQEHNALEAERLGLATRVERITSDALRRFFDTARPQGLGFADPSDAFVSWLERCVPVSEHDGAFSSRKIPHLDEETWTAFWGGRRCFT